MEASTRPPPLRAILVEDNPLDHELIVHALEEAGYRPEISRVQNAAELIAGLEAGPDIVLCDYNLPGFDAGAALEIVRARDPDLPFIIVSGSIGEETAVDLIKRGADDYLLKDRLGRLGPAVTHAILQKQLRAEARRAEEDLRQSEFKYREVFERVPEASYLCDSADGRIIDTNRRGETMLGLSRSAILGRRLGLFLPEAVCRSLLALPLQDSAPEIELDTELSGPGGEHTPVHLNATNLTLSHRRLLLTFVRPLSP